MLSAQFSIDKVALGIDIRGRKFFETLYESLSYLEKENYEYEILYLDCSDDVLLKRYKMTRRNHPLSKIYKYQKVLKWKERYCSKGKVNLHNRYYEYEA